MKKILILLLLFAVIGRTTELHAQCTVSDINVIIRTCGTSSGNLNVKFDVSFKILNNGGNKYIFIHSYRTTQYPNYWNCASDGTTKVNKPPMNTAGGGQNNTALANAFLNIAIDNNAVIPILLPTYNPDPTNVSITPVDGISKVVNGDGSAVFTLTGVQVTIPGVTSCTDPLGVTSDLWSSQASDGQVAHCANCGIVQYFNDPLIQGIVPCSSPRVINFALTSVQINTQFYYRIFRDNGNGAFQPGTGDVDVTVGVNPTVTTNGAGLVALNQYPVSQQLPGDTLGQYWVRITKVGAISGIATLIKPFPGAKCFPLPVQFKSFTATRSKSNVMVKWETATETNNSGFAVERNINGNWEELAFIPSQAQIGNSTTDLSYQYIDINNSKGISQYRIKQVDIDNKSKYTEVRSVKGDGQIGKVVVYPNPTVDGKVNVVFDDASVVRDISVIDMSGRTIRAIRGISNNNITIDNLAPGIYSLRIFVPATGEQVVEKILVNQR